MLLNLLIYLFTIQIDMYKPFNCRHWPYSPHRW